MQTETLKVITSFQSQAFVEMQTVSKTIAGTIPVFRGNRIAAISLYCVALHKGECLMAQSSLGLTVVILAMHHHKFQAGGTKMVPLFGVEPRGQVHATAT